MGIPEEVSEDGQTEERQTVPLCYSTRLILAILLFAGLMNVYIQRVSIAIAIVCMVNHTALDLEEEESLMDASEAHGDVQKFVCGSSNISELDLVQEDGPFMWNKGLQGHILAAYFYGSMVTQMPGGRLAERYGGKNVFTLSFAVGTVAMFLTPLAARTGVGYLIAARVVTGLGGGALFPVNYSIWGHWAAPVERSTVLAITIAGGIFGSIVAYPLGAILCKSGFDDGWASVFYVFGMVSASWLVLWLFYAADTPANHRWISTREKEYIHHSLEGQTSTSNTKSSFPWLKVSTSLPYWSTVFANVVNDWGLITLLTNIPTYLFEVLKFDIQSNGLYSALPFIGHYISWNVGSVVADLLRARRILSTTATRKIFFGVGFFGSAIFLVALSFLDCENTGLAVTCLTLALTFKGIGKNGYMPNYMDIGPKYAGTLLGISNVVCSTTGFLAPLAAAGLTPNQSREEWQNVFFITAGFYVLGVIVFSLFASGEVQEWAKDDMSDRQTEYKNTEDVITHM